MTNAKYNLKERTFKFSQSLISVCSQIPKNPINNPIISQVIRSGTSIGANYAEADNASTKKDFLNKLSIVLKEVNETKYWLQLIRDILQENKHQLVDSLYKETQELNLIFATIIRKTRENLDAKSDIRH